VIKNRGKICPPSRGSLPCPALLGEQDKAKILHLCSL